VIRIRMEGLRAGEFNELLQNGLRQCAEDLKSGALVSVDDFKIRVRRPPVS